MAITATAAATAMTVMMKKMHMRRTTRRNQGGIGLSIFLLLTLTLHSIILAFHHCHAWPMLPRITSSTSTTTTTRTRRITVTLDAAARSDSQYYSSFEDEALSFRSIYSPSNKNNNNNNNKPNAVSGSGGVRITLTRYLEDVAKENPELQDVVSLLSAVRMACKTISNLVHRAGLSIHTNNVEDQQQQQQLDGRYHSMQRLDQLSTTVLKNALKYTGKCHVVTVPPPPSNDSSEEYDNELKQQQKQQPSSGVLIAKPMDSKYVACLDPLDGSGNADASICTGTIFGVFYDDNDDNDYNENDSNNYKDWTTLVLQPAQNMKAAGYCLYSSATILVFTLGGGKVQAFTLDPVIQEFVLTHPNLRIPVAGSVYSVNEANSEHGWNIGFQNYLKAIKTGTGIRRRNQQQQQPPNNNEIRYSYYYAHRYVGSMVGDIHRTLMYGGIFAYPSDRVRHPFGNLPLLYKIAPMAFLLEQAGGKAITEPTTTNNNCGCCSILSVRPQHIHQKAPCFLGSPDDVDECASYLLEAAVAEAARSNNTTMTTV